MGRREEAIKRNMPNSLARLANKDDGEHREVIRKVLADSKVLKEHRMGAYESGLLVVGRDAKTMRRTAPEYGDRIGKVLDLINQRQGEDPATQMIDLAIGSMLIVEQGAQLVDKIISAKGNRLLKLAEISFDSVNLNGRKGLWTKGDPILAALIEGQDEETQKMMKKILGPFEETLGLIKVSKLMELAAEKMRGNSERDLERVKRLGNKIDPKKAVETAIELNEEVVVRDQLRESSRQSLGGFVEDQSVIGVEHVDVHSLGTNLIAAKERAKNAELLRKTMRGIKVKSQYIREQEHMRVGISLGELSAIDHSTAAEFAANLQLITAEMAELSVSNVLLRGLETARYALGAASELILNRGAAEAINVGGLEEEAESGFKQIDSIIKVR